MAGIVGFIGEHISNENPNIIDLMSQEIQYVNNDFVDYWNDGYLSISRVHHGVLNPEKQPIFSEDNSLIIFMDGEVYDYETEKQFLLNKGHRFKYSNNDAEFCLHLYEELGEESFKNLNGSFLTAIYDPRIKELILVNDRFSSYPLFFYAEGGDLIFGSQLKAVIQSRRVPKNLNVNAIMEYFTFNQVLQTSTRTAKILMQPIKMIQLYVKVGHS